MSEALFDRYLTQILLRYTNRIQSLRISIPHAADICSFFLPMIKNFTQLTTLIINHTESMYVQIIVDSLSSLPALYPH